MNFQKLWLVIVWKAIIFTCEIIINDLACEIIIFISARNPYKALYFISIINTTTTTNNFSSIYSTT